MNTKGQKEETLSCDLFEKQYVHILLFNSMVKTYNFGTC